MTPYPEPVEFNTHTHTHTQTHTLMSCFCNFDCNAVLNNSVLPLLSSHNRLNECVSEGFHECRMVFHVSPLLSLLYFPKSHGVVKVSARLSMSARLRHLAEQRYCSNNFPDFGSGKRWVVSLTPRTFNPGNYWLWGWFGPTETNLLPLPEM